MSESGLSLGRVLDVLRAADLLLEASVPEDTRVQGVSQDSRTTGSGDLFLCWEGTEHDAHEHLPEAAEKGALAAVVERVVPDVDIPQIRVRGGRRAAALVADAFFRSPWRDLFMVGVTGTNGKTTTVLLCRHLLSLREPTAALGTLGMIGPNGEPHPGTEGLTTPGPVQLSGWLRSLADEGVEAVAMETSSHALEQERLDGIGFDVAVFTNLSQDHLDYHGTEEAYLRAKARLLKLLAPTGVRIVNGADAAWEALPPHPGRRLVFRILEDAEREGPGEDAGGSDQDLVARGVHLGAEGASFVLEHQGERELVELPLLGRFNIENALGAAGVALTRGHPLGEVARGLREAPQLPGRLEVVHRGGFTVVVDFAHSPAALVRVLEALRPLFPGRLIVVFGAGGDRDPSKRAPMGRAVSAVADLPVVTSDNPRTEDPEAIIDDIVAGMGGLPYERILDRRGAIARALEVARDGDVVLLAGKGHERAQTIGREKVPFDEREIVRDFLKRRGAG